MHDKYITIDICLIYYPSDVFIDIKNVRFLH